MLSRRSIVASSGDVKYLYYVTPWNLDEWISRVNRQRIGLQSPTGSPDDQGIIEFVQELNIAEFKDVTDWYAVVRARHAPAIATALEIIESGGWGKHYHLYRIR